LAALAILFARPLLRLFGEPFVAAAGPLAVLAAGWTVHALVGLCGTVIGMSGRSKLQLLDNIVLLAVNVGLLLALVPRHGMMGAAAATAGGIVFYDLMTWLQIKRILGLDPFRRDILKPLAAAAFAAAVLAIVGALLHGEPGWPHMAAGSALFLLVYGAAMLGLGIRDEDKAVLRKILSKLKIGDQAGSEWTP
jgi:O-antigen/teichoic acid export membrane protein